MTTKQHYLALRTHFWPGQKRVRSAKSCFFFVTQSSLWRCKGRHRWCPSAQGQRKAIRTNTKHSLNSNEFHWIPMRTPWKLQMFSLNSEGYPLGKITYSHWISKYCIFTGFPRVPLGNYTYFHWIPKVHPFKIRVCSLNSQSIPLQYVPMFTEFPRYTFSRYEYVLWIPKAYPFKIYVFSTSSQRTPFQNIRMFVEFLRYILWTYTYSHWSPRA